MVFLWCWRPFDVIQLDSESARWNECSRLTIRYTLNFNPLRGSNFLVFYIAFWLFRLCIHNQKLRHIISASGFAESEIFSVDESAHPDLNAARLIYARFVVFTSQSCFVDDTHATGQYKATPRLTPHCLSAIVPSASLDTEFKCYNNSDFGWCEWSVYDWIDTHVSTVNVVNRWRIIISVSMICLIKIILIHE